MASPITPSAERAPAFTERTDGDTTTLTCRCGASLSYRGTDYRLSAFRGVHAVCSLRSDMAPLPARTVGR